MLDQPDKHAAATKAPALDFQEHLAALEMAGLLVRIDRPIDKDTELHPLVRWQFLGGVPEDKRRAFLFTNVTDSKGRHYDMPVVVGALAASPEIYALGMGEPVEQIGEATGGPEVYTGRSMVEAHAGLGITVADFNALVEDLVLSLDAFEVPEAEKSELLDALGPMQPEIVTA